VLRLGESTSEFERWRPTPESPEPEHPQTREVVGEPKAQYYPLTAEAALFSVVAMFLCPSISCSLHASRAAAGDLPMGRCRRLPVSSV